MASHVLGPPPLGGVRGGLTIMKKETTKWIVNIIVSILTAIATALGTTSCMG